MDTLTEATQDPTIEIPVDGDQVAATRYKPPTDDGPYPALLWVTPYDKDDVTTFGGYDPLHEYLAINGYEVVVANLPGTGASTGHFTDLTAPETGRHTATIIEWLADQSWTTGNVGLYGKSAAGYTTLAGAAENPNSLGAAIPMMTPAQRRRAVYAPGGLFRLQGVLRWLALYGTVAVEPPTRRDHDTQWRERWQERLDRLRKLGPKAIGIPDVFSHGRDDEYWEWALQIDDITAPTLAVGGFRDDFSTETISYFKAIDAPKRLLMGPWRHISPYMGRETAVDFRRQAANWFDQFLKNKDRGVLDRPTITYWTELDGGRQIGHGTWRGLDTWPTVETAATPVRFTVTPAGLAADWHTEGETVERFYSFNHTVGVDTMDYGSSFLDTNADDVRSLVFETSRLAAPLDWTGSGRATIQLASSVPRAALCLRVIDVAPNGRARPITHGARRLGDAPQGVKVKPDDTRPIQVPLRPASHLVEPDHRLRLAISAADFPRYRPVGDRGEFTITSSPNAPTTLTFPGEREAGVPPGDEVSMESPDESVPVAPPAVESQEAMGTTCRDHGCGRTTVQREQAVDFALPSADKNYSFEWEASSTSETPSDAEGMAQFEYTLDYGTETVEVTSTARITQDDLKLTLAVDGDGTSRFEESWTH